MDELSHVPRAELVHDVAAMHLDRAHADAQPLADLPVAIAIAGSGACVAHQQRLARSDHVAEITDLGHGEFSLWCGSAGVISFCPDDARYDVDRAVYSYAGGTGWIKQHDVAADTVCAVTQDYTVCVVENAVENRFVFQGAGRVAQGFGQAALLTPDALRLLVFRRVSLSSLACVRCVKGYSNLNLM